MSVVEINLPTGVIKKYVRNATSVVEVPLNASQPIIMQDNISEVSSISDYIQAPTKSPRPTESNENKVDPPAIEPTVLTQAVNIPTQSVVKTPTPAQESQPVVSTPMTNKVVNFADLGERVSVQSPKVSIGGDNNIQSAPNQIDKSYKHKIILPASMFFIGMAVGLKK